MFQPPKKKLGVEDVIIFFLRDHFSKVSDIINKLEKLYEIKIQDITELLKLWEGDFDGRKAEKLLQDVPSKNKELIRELDLLQRDCIVLEKTLGDIAGSHSKLLQSLKRMPLKGLHTKHEVYHAELTHCLHYGQLATTLLNTLLHILANQQEFLKANKDKMGVVVQNYHEHSALYYLLNDEHVKYHELSGHLSEIIKRLDYLIKVTSLQTSSAPPSQGGFPFTVTEIVGDKKTEMLMYLYNDVYCVLFPDEDERSPLDKLLTSLSQRYDNRTYHIFALMRGPLPVGALFVDFYETEPEDKALFHGKKVCFAMVMYVFVADNIKQFLKPSDTRLLLKYALESLTKDAEVRNGIFIGMFGEIDDLTKMPRELVESSVVNPGARERLFSQSGARKLDIDYWQPAENEEMEPVPYLALVFYPTFPELIRGIHYNTLKAMLRKVFRIEYFSETVRKNSLLLQRLCDEIDQKVSTIPKDEDKIIKLLKPDRSWTNVPTDPAKIEARWEKNMPKIDWYYTGGNGADYLKAVGMTYEDYKRSFNEK